MPGLFCTPVFCGDRLGIPVTAQIHHTGARITSDHTALFLSEPPKHQMPVLIKEDDRSMCFQLLSYAIHQDVFKVMQHMGSALQQCWGGNGARELLPNLLEASLHQETVLVPPKAFKGKAKSHKSSGSAIE